MCVILGLCSSKDAAIVRGSAKPQEKNTFLQNLVDLALLNATQQQIQPQANERLLSDIIVDSTAILSKQVSLFPTDMDPIYASKNTTSAPLDIEGLISQIKAELDRVQLTLASVDVTGLKVGSSAPVTDIDTLKKTVARQFTQLHTIVAQFNAIYESDILPWCGQRGDTQLVGLGPKAAELLNIQQPLQDMLSNIKQLKNGYQRIVSHESASELAKCDIEINEHTILAVQAQSMVLEKAFTRKQEIGYLYGH
jgi:hypothetical protein